MTRTVATLVLAVVVARAIAATGADFTITQKNRAFSTRQIAVKVGDQITFVNQDDVRHNVYSETKGLEFDLVQPPGSTNTVRFAQPGTATVQCAIHPVMKLEVRVTP